MSTRIKYSVCCSFLIDEDIKLSEWRHSISLRLMFKNASIAMMKTDKTCGKVNHSSSAKKKTRMPFVLLNLPSKYVIISIHINKAFRWLIYLVERIAWEHLAKNKRYQNKSSIFYIRSYIPSKIMLSSILNTSKRNFN